MNILVTGGAGYIGSVVAADLLKAGHSVIAFDNLSRGHREAVPAGAQFVVGELADHEALHGLFEENRVDAVMHFAAFAEASESMSVPELYFRNNAANTLTLLEAMLEHGVKKIVFSSTAAVYGNPERLPIEETDTLEPTNPYGESKLLGEKMLAWFNRCHGLSYASLRYFNTAGASGGLGEDHRPESHLIPRVLKAALGQIESISILGTDYPTDDGTCVRDYIHVADLSDAHLLALDALTNDDVLIYTLGNGTGFSVRGVIGAAERITGCTIPAVEADRRAGDPAILVASSEKIQRELGWRPRFSDLESIIGSAWDWHRRFPRGYRDSNEAASINA